MKIFLIILIVLTCLFQSCECGCEDKFKYHIRIHVAAKHNEYYCTNAFNLSGNRTISFIDENGKFVEYKDGEYHYFEIANQDR